MGVYSLELQITEKSLKHPCQNGVVFQCGLLCALVEVKFIEKEFCAFFNGFMFGQNPL